MNNFKKILDLLRRKAFW